MQAEPALPHDSGHTGHAPDVGNILRFRPHVDGIQQQLCGACDGDAAPLQICLTPA
jgi:hypothetical protein